MDRSTITRAIGEVRPLLAERGCTVSPDVRLRSLAEVIDHLGTSGTTGIIDSTEIRVRRPPPDARTATSSSLARTSRTLSSSWWSRTAKAACCGAAQHGPQAVRSSPKHANLRWSGSYPTDLRSRACCHQQTVDLNPTQQT
ncbi:hypothetical protein ABTZ59_27850 [Streptomyces sp. NPDC094034]|uniref:hypothetical protein n=1 Tax=Streptomyces sp. NPDC094034 TaxID=3155309 RepID=UPI00331FDE9B